MYSIVLQRRDFREDDQILSFYTAEFGKIELLARGVKKIESKNSPHLEPPSLVDMAFVRGKEIDRLTKVQPAQSFKNIRSDLHKSLTAEYASKMLDKIVEPRAKDERIFDLFLGWLQFIENAKLREGDVLLLAGFVFKFFSYLGFQPALHRCVVGEEEIVQAGPVVSPLRMGTAGGLPTTPLGFYFAGGGVVCPEHKAEKQRVGEAVIDISFKQISNLRLLLIGDWQTTIDIRLDTKEAQHLWNIVFQFAQFHSEKKLPIYAIM